MRTILFSVILLSFSTINAQAQSKHLTVQKATVQNRGLAAVSEDGHHHGHTEYRMTIVWNTTLVPNDFYYRADAAHWLKCKVTRPEKRMMGNNIDFMIVEKNIKATDVRNGDNLILTPEEFPSELQPDNVKRMPTGCLYYSLGTSTKWNTAKIAFTKLPDVVPQSLR